MEIIAYIMLIALVLSVLLLIWCGCELAKLEKQNPENIVLPSVDDINFVAMSKWEMDFALREAYKMDKKLAKMRRNYRRIIYS